MGLGLEWVPGQTPLNDEEKEGLLLNGISTQAELNEQEQLNIEVAYLWLLKLRLSPEKLMSAVFLKQLHAKMFNGVWRWAGRFRKSDKNIGVPWYKVELELTMLLEDALFWIKHATYEPDEIALRFKHRLVVIHCFSNGNGRHSRIMADLIAEQLFKKEPFSWQGKNLQAPDLLRANYINALRQADKGDYQTLVEFARG